jgi:hypothetical protein
VAEAFNPGEYATHQDNLLLQVADGDFEVFGTEVGLSPATTEDSLDAERAYSSRGAIRADLDHDGWLDLIHTGISGYLKLHIERPTQDNAPIRCTLRPLTRIAPSMGHSVGIAAEGEDDFHYREIQGQIRWGTSPWLMTTVRRGTVRFPSGGRTEFDCGEGAGPIDVEEPEWIRVRRVGDTLEITIDAPWLAGELLVESAVSAGEREAELRPAITQAEGVWTVALVQSDSRAMIRINQVWVPRWWAIPR